MGKLSKSQVQAAVSAIVERRKREEITSPEQIYQRHQVWIRRNLNNHLEPVLAEAMDKIGLDRNKINYSAA